jgi:hypothetical protein
MMTEVLHATEAVPDSREMVESEEFRKQAVDADKHIRESLRSLKRSWVSLGRLCEDFKEKDYHRAIIDTKTGKPFTNFGTWARSVFGKSQSTIFKELRILRILKGRVGDEELSKIPKENAAHVADVVANGGELAPAMVKQARDLPEREFRETLVGPSALRTGENFHPRKFSTDVSPETYDRLQEMLCAARLRTGGQKSQFGIDDLPLRDVADEYLKLYQSTVKKEPYSELVKTMAAAV